MSALGRKRKLALPPTCRGRGAADVPGVVKGRRNAVASYVLTAAAKKAVRDIRGSCPTEDCLFYKNASAPTIVNEATADTAAEISTFPLDSFEASNEIVNETEVTIPRP